MFRKVRIGLYHYYDVKDIERYSKFYMERLVRRDENYNAGTIKKLVNDISKYYKNMKTKELYFEKKKLKLKIDSYQNIDLMNYAGILVSIIFVCISISSSVLVTITGIDKTKIIDLILYYGLGSLICIFVVYIINERLNRKYNRSFDILCLDILEEVEKDRIGKAEKQRMLHQQGVIDKRKS
ncbi:hypothetical protein [Clostridium estertheticum]|uniref:hypothetical protein n=1 Tax=Clostridium estertheticum TaxID=238834 RepID=UPI001CF5CA7C|nr:hypothetical protein [Clostridium estertheticum]MCB2340888.1 hypothetical protein [Clostridium estertheticum]